MTCGMPLNNNHSKSRCRYEETREEEVEHDRDLWTNTRLSHRFRADLSLVSELEAIRALNPSAVQLLSHHLHQALAPGIRPKND